jgi:hypothetical protein
MSDMVKRYEESKMPRPVQAKQIPGLAVNYFDRISEWQDEFKIQRKKGDPTDFTEKALAHRATEVKEIIIPDGFTPTEQGIPLNRYGPENKYFNPGQQK